jgi:hypothetical protein
MSLCESEKEEREGQERKGSAARRSVFESAVSLQGGVSVYARPAGTPKLSSRRRRRPVPSFSLGSSSILALALDESIVVPRDLLRDEEQVNGGEREGVK